MTRSGRSLAWLLTAMFLAGSACTSDDMKALPKGNDSQIGSTGNLVLHQSGSTVGLLDSKDADEIRQTTARLIESCKAQLKKRVSGGDWQAARLAPYSLELRSASNITISLDNGAMFEMQAAIITIEEESPSHTSVLTLADDQYRSPLVHCSVVYTLALKDLVDNAMHLR